MRLSKLIQFRLGKLSLKRFVSYGFTLIEVVVVMAIIAVLAALVVGAITVARNTALETANRSNARTIQTAQEAYYAKYQRYQSTWGSGVEGGASNFETVESNLNLGISLSSGGCPGSSPTSSKGGNMAATANGYNIYIANKNCNASSGDSSTYLDRLSNQ